MTLSVGEDKLSRVMREVQELQSVTKCSRKKLEKLAGLLAHCASGQRGQDIYKTDLQPTER